MVQRAAFKPDGSIHLETTGSAFNAPYPGLLKIFMLLVLIALTIQFVVLAINYVRAKPYDMRANSGAAKTMTDQNSCPNSPMHSMKTVISGATG